ncbi:transposase [Methanotorris formicicus]|uniref:transposase n=1 Tax=Methanotorris formicicus TaxID=213185 RepID=UPI00315CF1B1
MADSTGVSINRLYCECIHGGKRTNRLVYDKLHILAYYYPKQGYIPIVSARWGEGHSSDSTNLLEMVKQVDFLDNEYLLADRGYDCCELFEYLLQHNITPIVKTKEFKWNYKVSKS